MTLKGFQEYYDYFFLELLSSYFFFSVFCCCCCFSILQSLLNLLQYCFFVFWFFGCEACWILAPKPRIEPIPPALEGEGLTTGPPGKSLYFFISNLTIQSLDLKVSDSFFPLFYSFHVEILNYSIILVNLSHRAFWKLFIRCPSPDLFLAQSPVSYDHRGGPFTRLTLDICPQQYFISYFKST